jgi:hypothetical protein
MDRRGDSKVKSVLTKLQQLSFYVKQTSDDEEMIFRCPLHEDRRGHLYVSTENLEYICFKCGVRGKSFIKFLITHNRYLNNDDKLVLTDILSDLVLLSESEIHEQYDNVENEIDSVNNGTYQKIRLFHELIDLLNNHAKKNRQVIYRYFSSTRHIIDRNYIDELINNGYVLFYSKELFTTVSSYIESIFNKKMIRIDQAIVLTTPGSGILQFRVLDKNVDNRLRYYTLKLKEINPNVFYIGNIRNPQTCIVVEGIFDAIKLNYLFKEHMDNYIIVALMGKNNVNSITEIRNLLNNVSVYVIALDMDVSVGDIISVYNVINNKVNNRKDKMVYVLTKRSNNVTDKDFDGITDFNEFKEKFVLVNYTKYTTGVWKLSNLFDVVEED